MDVSRAETVLREALIAEGVKQTAGGVELGSLTRAFRRVAAHEFTFDEGMVEFDELKVEYVQTDRQLWFLRRMQLIDDRANLRGAVEPFIRVTLDFGAARAPERKSFCADADDDPNEGSYVDAQALWRAFGAFCQSELSNANVVEFYADVERDLEDPA